MDDRARELLSPLPPSAKLVYYVLDEEGRFDQTGLAEETRLSVRTVRYALNRLTEEGIVEQVPCLSDGRQTLYDLNDDADEEIEADAETEIAD